MSDQSDGQTTGDGVPETMNSGRTSVPQDFTSLEDWFSSDEFLQRLTNGFWEAKKTSYRRARPIAAVCAAQRLTM